MFLENRNRRVVPRWRDHKTTLALRELSNAKAKDPMSAEDTTALARRASEWHNNTTIWHAADLLSSAYVVGIPDHYMDAIDFILAHPESAPTPLVDLAKRAASPVGRELADLHQVDEEEGIRRRIHNARVRLRDEPRNAILWVELSRMYMLVGESVRALRSMEVAAQLGADSRFVVRSAARLFLHERDSTRALQVIRRASGAKTDPWLLAAEIAVASASNSPPLLARAGRLRNDDTNLSEFERTELSSALATLELESGRDRKARQLFRRSLNAPNENSVAQVEWANRQIGGLEIQGNLFDVPRSFEASAQICLSNGEWRGAIEYGENWLRDQPFSKSPAIFTSYVSSLIEEYGSSIEILRTSLKLNPSDPTLINNLAFALASSGEVAEATRILAGTDYKKSTGTRGITLSATHGLVFFRAGMPELGRELYQLAAERAAISGMQKYRLMADLYLAREELLAATSVANVTAKRALASAANSTDREVSVIADQVRRLCEKAIESETRSARSIS